MQYDNTRGEYTYFDRLENVILLLQNNTNTTVSTLSIEERVKIDKKNSKKDTVDYQLELF